MNLKDYTEMQRLKNNLYHYFRHARAGRASVSLLFTKGREIEEKITSLKGFYESQEHESLEKVFSFVDELHDKSTRDYLSKNLYEIDLLMKSLSI